jgi:hypothetical protein
MHRRHRRDRLGHRGDAKQRICRQWTRRRNIRYAKGTLIDDTPPAGDERNDARHLVSLDRLTQSQIDRRAFGRLCQRRVGGGRECDWHGDEDRNYCSDHGL